jgi:hypothetical protein
MKHDIKLVPLNWVVDSIGQQCRQEEMEYDLIPCLSKPNCMAARIAESFPEQYLFEGYNFYLDDDEILAEEIARYGGTLVDSETSRMCDEVYVIMDESGEATKCHARNCHFRTSTWLQDCINVRSCIFLKDIAMFRHLLHSPWPSVRIGGSDVTFSIAVTGVVAVSRPRSARQSLMRGAAGYTGAKRDSLQELIQRTKHKFTKTLSRENTHLICLAHRWSAVRRSCLLWSGTRVLCRMLRRHDE